MALTHGQYKKVMNVIWKSHRFGRGGRHIKYVRPNWDMRDDMCFSIRFDGLGCDREGTSFGSGHTEREPMYDRIMAWLNQAIV